LAVRHPEALRFLIENGADPNARDIEDNAGPLHFAAANGEIESVRTLLDLGANVHGSGDLHNSEVIGWAAKPGNEPVINLLQERGARHHIFSAMALGDRNLVQKLVEENPECLARRRSRFESGQTPVHAALAPPDGLGFIAGKPDYEMLQLLIELGADVEAPDGKGRTPLAVAMLRGDIEAMSLLKAAGAQEPAESLETDRIADLATVTQSIRKSSPMFAVRDMRQTVNWYESLGFTLEDSFEDGEELVFARVSLGQAEFTLGPGGNPGPRDVTLWFFTDQVGQLYQLLRDRQMRNAQASLSGSPQDTAVRFKEDLYSPFYGGQQFSIEDINGMTLIFWQSK
jgi:catechol 2,3-dioxygenase-like lactoylglutathione lyase family enzyme